ncbi:MAG: MmgE/PrpD family protein [Chloroflexota bacterium]|nr:MmgE/PrpD family protein [Chloroflexota bacterium]
MRRADLSPLVVERATDSILDTAAVTIAGAREPAVRIAREIVEAEGARPVASQLGGTFRGSEGQAALLNGIAGHVLDYDDVSWEILGHPSAVVLPAVLAVAEATKASGSRALTAYVVGIEVMSKVARALGPRHYESGWHMTATAGTIGAAMAASSVLGLDAPHAAHALAIAVSLASGTRQNFGSMTKSLHVGHAASAGIRAARLARGGFTGNAEAIEGRQGYFALLSPESDAADIGVLGEPYELASPGLSYKMFPACYGAHRGIQATLEVAARDGIRAPDVTAIRVSAPATELDPLVDGIPTTGLEGKFSMAYAVAAALLDGKVGLATFTDEMVRRPEAQALMRHVTVETQPEAATRVEAGQGRVDVAVTTRDGRAHDASVAHPPGSPGAPLTRADLVAKLTDCAGPALGDRGVRDLIHAVEGLDRASNVDALLESARPAPVAV